MRGQRDSSLGSAHGQKISVTLHTLHAHVTCENLKEEFQCAEILRSNRAAAAERPGGLAV